MGIRERATKSNSICDKLDNINKVDKLVRNLACYTVAVTSDLVLADFVDDFLEKMVAKFSKELLFSI